MSDDEDGPDQIGPQGQIGPQRDRPQPGRSQTAPGRSHGRLRRITGWLSVFVVLVLTAGVLFAYYEYRHLWDGIAKFAVTDLGKRPPVYNDAMNLLVFGTDSRAGLDFHQQVVLHVGRPDGEDNTDTVMLVHILPGRKGAIVVSFPRDTQVPYYACAAGAGHPGQRQDLTATERINAVYAAGGPSCLWKTVEHISGIHIDHAIEVNFGGFVKIINDLGGVNVCVNRPVYDSVSGLHLHKGVNHLGGVEALKFWRTREGIGLGDDPQRIQRDQFLMASLLQGIERSHLLGDPARLVHVLTDAASSMMMDDGMTPSDVLQIAQSLRGLPPGSVQFITAPWVLDQANPNVVDLQQPQASALFTAIAHDQTLPKAHRGHQRRRGSVTTLTRAARPSSVKVEVLNGSGVSGQAAIVAASLTHRGFVVVGRGDAANFSYTTSVIEYATAADLPAANELKAQLSSVRLQQTAGLTAGTVELIVGSDYTGLKPRTTKSASVGHLSHKYHGITGSASVCRDSLAFAGPLGY